MRQSAQTTIPPHITPQKNMRNEENIGHIVRDKHAITSLSLS